MEFGFQNSYSGLPDRFYAKVTPSPVTSPTIVKFNNDLAKSLNLELPFNAEELALVFSGNKIPQDADPIALAYAGHQFGGWSPQLGDGRAHLLGDVICSSGVRYDIQLKGSGRTPWSRGGDGRAWLGPVLREYLVSEAMFALGVPTTRALTVVSTGEDVFRDQALPGAVLTRVARSHLRVGTFQYFAAREDHEALALLLDFAIDQLSLELKPQKNKALRLLDYVVAAQAELVASWMGLGFIHGVMNTDNCSISGETIDYGPCAFMDHYEFSRVFSSIDQNGRYAYGNQPRICHWNLAQLASSLLPLVHADQDKAVELATRSIDIFPELYRDAWLRNFGAKIGVEDAELIANFLAALDADKADFTNSFRKLSDLIDDGDFGPTASNLNEWLRLWRAKNQGVLPVDLDKVNPAVIPRNHQVERMIEEAVAGDFSRFHMLCDVLSRPFEAPQNKSLMLAPEPDEIVQATFCGT